MLPSSVVCIIQRIRKTASGFEEIDSSSFNSSLVFLFFFFAVFLLNLFDRGYKKNGTVFRFVWRKNVGNVALFPMSKKFLSSK